MSFLEGDEKEGSRPSQVFGSIQIVPQGPHRTQGPVFFELSIYNGIQSRKSHRRRTLRTFCGSWFLAVNSEDGNKATFSHWPRLDTLFATSGMDFAAALAGGQSYQQSSFESKMFEVCVFHRLKRRVCELIENNRKVPFWKIPGTFWTILVKTGE